MLLKLIIVITCRFFYQMGMNTLPEISAAAL